MSCLHNHVHNSSMLFFIPFIDDYTTDMWLSIVAYTIITVSVFDPLKQFIYKLIHNMTSITSYITCFLTFTLSTLLGFVFCVLSIYQKCLVCIYQFNQALSMAFLLLPCSHFYVELWALTLPLLGGYFSLLVLKCWDILPYLWPLRSFLHHITWSILLKYWKTMVYLYVLYHIFDKVHWFFSWMNA